MKHMIFTLSLVLGLPYGFASHAQQQTADQADTAFASQNAILDTAIPFAIGAQEAQQNLRGAFGWPTFQEGFVEGVYFRFDPDGYARFSPSPRLDTDVSEVICQPRTYNCMGRKGSMNILLSDVGKIQLQINGVTQGDTIHLVDGTSQIQLPDRILHPLDPQFETLLSTGGDLVIRRGDTVYSTTSLIGFSAVISYLRWLKARQDYTVLPRNWPVPNSTQKAQSGSITQAANWASPMPQPQTLQNTIPAAATTLLQPQNAAMAKVQTELTLLKELLAMRQTPPEQAPQDNEAAPQPAAQIQPEAAPTTALSNEQFTLLEGQIQLVLSELALLKQVEMAQPQQAPEQQPQAAADASSAPAYAPLVAETTAPASVQNVSSEIEHLNYLITNMGVDPKTALILLQFLQSEDGITHMGQFGGALQKSYHDTIAESILADVEQELQPQPAPQQVQSLNAYSPTEEPLTLPAPQQSDKPQIPQGKTATATDYRPLTDYFKSILFAAQ